MKDTNHISLNEIDKKLPFKVPENYFDNFAVQIDRQIAANRQISHRRIQKWIYAVAASLVGIAIMTQVYVSNNSKEKTATADKYETYVLSQVDESTLMDYYLDSGSTSK
jgi:hypothetical protein